MNDDGSHADWRDEIECEQCRAWTGKSPISLVALRRQFPPECGFTVSRACFLCRDADGALWHIPTTMLDGNGIHYQWFPEPPPGHRPYGG